MLTTVYIRPERYKRNNTLSSLQDNLTIESHNKFLQQRNDQSNVYAGAIASTHRLNI